MSYRRAAVAEELWQRSCCRGAMAEELWQSSNDRGAVAQKQWQESCAAEQQWQRSFGRGAMAGEPWQSCSGRGAAAEEHLQKCIPRFRYAAKPHQMDPCPIRAHRRSSSLAGICHFPEIAISQNFLFAGIRDLSQLANFCEWPVPASGKLWQAVGSGALHVLVSGTFR